MLFDLSSCVVPDTIAPTDLTPARRSSRVEFRALTRTHGSKIDRGVERFALSAFARWICVRDVACVCRRSSIGGMKRALLRTRALCGALAFWPGHRRSRAGVTSPSTAGSIPTAGNGAAAAAGAEAANKRWQHADPPKRHRRQRKWRRHRRRRRMRRPSVPDPRVPQQRDGTTLTGHVYDPAGNNALYDVVVYVPNETPAPITPGVDATSCSGDLLYTGDADRARASPTLHGAFTVVPIALDGTDIPLVVQIGKWRTQIKIPSGRRCCWRIGRHQRSRHAAPSGEAHAPQHRGHRQLAASPRGSSRTFRTSRSRRGAPTRSSVCSVASASTRWSTRRAPAAPVTFTSSRAAARARRRWWGARRAIRSFRKSSATLSPYDIVLLSCEGAPTAISDVPGTTAALQTYTAAGGRVFAEHYHYEFFSDPAVRVSPPATTSPIGST